MPNRRLAAAVTTGPEWGLSFTYDGFGNKTDQTVTKGSAPHYSGLVDPAMPVVLDRLGSVRIRGNERLDYFPYGEEKPGATTQDRYKFGTYYRDSATGLDYADQRYYSSVTGRFITPDPIDGKPCTPQSWNRYAYVQGDPSNFNDPDGTLPANVSYDGGFGCVPTGLVAPGGTVDASSPCPPGFTVAYGGYGASKSRLQQVWEAFDPLTGVIEDWDYANQYGTRFDITLSVDRFAQGFLPQLAGAGAAGGVILIGGGPVTWTVTVTGAIVLGGVALWQTGVLQNIFLRGKSDPISGLKPTNPGRDASGRCNPCPPNPDPWQAPSDAHGSTSGTHWHWIEWNQNPDTCECYPKRVSGPTRP
jgi:RHS repeat-associated protein